MFRKYYGKELIIVQGKGVETSAYLQIDMIALTHLLLIINVKLSQMTCHRLLSRHIVYVLLNNQ